MKTIMTAFFLSLVATQALAAPIFARDAGAHVGQRVTVRDVVSGIEEIKNGIALDLGGRGRHARLVLVLQEPIASLIPDLDISTGKTVEAQGRVGVLNGRPVIYITRRTQLFFKD